MIARKTDLEDNNGSTGNTTESVTYYERRQLASARCSAGLTASGWCGECCIRRGNLCHRACVCVLEVFTRISLGTWTYLFQGVLVLSLMILRKRFVPQYLFSFVVGFVFGELLDVHEAWINLLPLTLPNRILYFAISYLLICIGIALSNRCGLPIIPTDLFPRELADITGAAYSNIKVSFDVICLAVTAGMNRSSFWDIDRTWNRNDSGGVYDGKGDRGDREMDGRAFAVRVGSDS